MFSKITSQKYQNFEINIISTSLSKNLGINYIFLIKCLISNKNICIDPASAKEVINFLEKQNQKLDFILNNSSPSRSHIRSQRITRKI